MADSLVTTQAELLPRSELAKIAGEDVAARRTQALENWQRQSLVIMPDAVIAIEAEIAVVRAEAEAADALAGEAKTLALEADNTANEALVIANEALAASGRASLQATAVGALTAGDFVHTYDSSGPQAEPASATDLTKPATGYVEGNANSGDPITVYLGGLNSALIGLTPGLLYWLSTSAGGVTATPPSASGNLDQPLGVAQSASSLLFVFNPGVGV